MESGSYKPNGPIRSDTNSSSGGANLSMADSDYGDSVLSSSGDAAAAAAASANQIRDSRSAASMANADPTVARATSSTDMPSRSDAGVLTIDTIALNLARNKLALIMARPTPALPSHDANSRSSGAQESPANVSSVQGGNLSVSSSNDGQSKADSGLSPVRSTSGAPAQLPLSLAGPSTSTSPSMKSRERHLNAEPRSQVPFPGPDPPRSRTPWVSVNRQPVNLLGDNGPQANMSSPPVVAPLNPLPRGPGHYRWNSDPRAPFVNPNLRVSAPAHAEPNPNLHQPGAMLTSTSTAVPPKVFPCQTGPVPTSSKHGSTNAIRPLVNPNLQEIAPMPPIPNPDSFGQRQSRAWDEGLPRKSSAGSAGNTQHTPGKRALVLPLIYMTETADYNSCSSQSSKTSPK